MDVQISQTPVEQQVSTANVPVNVFYRIFALVTDILVIIVPIPLLYLVVSTKYFTGVAGGDLLWFSTIGLVIGLVEWIYFISLVVLRGKSFGKMVFGLKIISKKTQEAPSFFQAFLREFIKFSFFTFSSVLVFIFQLIYNSPIAEGFRIILINMTLPLLLLTGVNVGMLLFKKKSIHDSIAKTNVIVMQSSWTRKKKTILFSVMCLGYLGYFIFFSRYLVIYLNIASFFTPR